MLRIALRVLYPTSSSLGGLVQYIELLSAVSVSSKLPQIFNFFLIYAREKANLGNFSRNYIVPKLFLCRSSLALLTVIARSGSSKKREGINKGKEHLKRSKMGKK